MNKEERNKRKKGDFELAKAPFSIKQRFPLFRL